MIAYYCVEDQLSRAVLERVLYDVLGDVHLIEMQANQGGSGGIKTKLSSYCTLAQHQQVIILIDLDQAECPPSLRRNWIDSAGLTDPLPAKMSFNIAVTEIEAWLLADRANLSSYLGVSANSLPQDTQIADPKKFLLDCVQKNGNRQAKTELLPKGNAKVGLGYNAFLIQFAMNHWNFHEASERNVSLRRALERIEAMRLPE